MIEFWVAIYTLSLHTRSYKVVIEYTYNFIEVSGWGKVSQGDVPNIMWGGGKLIHFPPHVLYALITHLTRFGHPLKVVWNHLEYLHEGVQVTSHVTQYITERYGGPER